MTQPYAPSETHPLNALRRTGIVQDVSTLTTGYVMVSLGDDDPTTAVPMTWVSGYQPADGDSVMIISVGGDHIIIGSIVSIGLAAKNGYIQAYNSVSINVPDATYTEMTYGTVVYGGDQASGQAYLDTNGKVVIPRTGIWQVTSSIFFVTASSAYFRTITLVGSTGTTNTSNPTRSELFPGATTSHWQSSNPFPLFFNAGDIISGFAWQNSGAGVTLTHACSMIVAYQIA